MIEQRHLPSVTIKLDPTISINPIPNIWLQAWTDDDFYPTILAAHPTNGSIAIFIDNVIYLWTLEKTIYELDFPAFSEDNPVLFLQFSPSGENLLVRTSKGEIKSLQIFTDEGSLFTDRVVREKKKNLVHARLKWETPANALNGTLSKKTSRPLATVKSGTLFEHAPGELTYAPVSDPNLPHTFSSNTPHQIIGMVSHPKKNWVISGTTNGELLIHDLDQKTSSEPLQAHKGSFKALSISPNGKYLASGGGSEDPKITIWEISEEEQTLTKLASQSFVMQITNLSWIDDKHLVCSSKGSDLFLLKGTKVHGHFQLSAPQAQPVQNWKRPHKESDFCNRITQLAVQRISGGEMVLWALHPAREELARLKVLQPDTPTSLKGTIPSHLRALR